eukprot:2237841-Rhodomonas_salina.1
MFNAGYIDSPRYTYLWYCYRYQSNVSYHWPQSTSSDLPVVLRRQRNLASQTASAAQATHWQPGRLA